VRTTSAAGRSCHSPSDTDSLTASFYHYHSFTGARMIDRLERRDGDPRSWGIAHRQLVWDWNHDAPEEEHWMRGLLTPDPSVLHLSGKFPADPVYAQ
jgi:hypothetical protein